MEDKQMDEKNVSNKEQLEDAALKSANENIRQKIKLFFMTILVWICGWIILWSALINMLQTLGPSLDLVIKSGAKSTSYFYMFILSSGLTVSVGVLAVCAIVHDNKKILQIFFVFVCVAVCIEVLAILAIAITFSQTTEQGALLRDFKESIDERYGDVTPDWDEQNATRSQTEQYYTRWKTTQVVDKIQTQYSCCGVVNFTDWLETSWHRLMNNFSSEEGVVGMVPVSCCKSNITADDCDRHISLTDNEKVTINTTTVDSKGCFNEVTQNVIRLSIEYAFLLTAIGLYQAVYCVSLRKYILNMRPRPESIIW